MPARTRRFVFTFRNTLPPDLIPSSRAEALVREGAKGGLPRHMVELGLEWRDLDLDVVAPLLAGASIVEAEFLGPVFGAMEVSITCSDDCVHRRAAEALTLAAMTAGGPVIRVSDGALRHPIKCETFPAEDLAEQPCFGRTLLLSLTNSELYQAHVEAAVKATLDAAKVVVDYMYNTFDKENVQLCFDEYPRGQHPSVWQWLSKSDPPTTAERLRGHEFRVIAYSRTLAGDEEFWNG